MAKKSVFETRLMSSKIKSSNVKLFPEAFLGYFGGPFFALVPNGIINVFLTQYWKNVLGLNSWAATFTWLMPLLSTILIVIGNLFVGKLIERKPKKAGKARPLLFLSIPLIAISLVAIFLAPFPYNGEALNNNITLITLIVTAVGYNLFYAIAWPIYYTSHSAMVNLSTRNGKQRSLLATFVNMAQVAAAGVAGMAGGYLTTFFRLVPSDQDSTYWTNVVKGADGSIVSYDIDQARLLADRQGANQRWMIVLIILVSLLVVGCLLEYFFTRERVTEEQVAAQETQGEKEKTKKVSMATQIKICMRDKYWWLVIIFFLLFQLGGCLKNNGQPFYSEAWTGNLNMASTIGIAGAAPTALGMLAVWPLANKFGKARTIKYGAIIAAICGLIGFIPLFTPWLKGDPKAIEGPINAFAITSFVTKALGTVPAMYISLALLGDVLDHQEALYGIRTDGFTMAIYGSIMIAMTGIANAMILGISGAVSNDLFLNRTMMTFLFFGGEVIAYLAIAFMFIFLKVEKFSKLDQETIVNRQKELCKEKGVEYVDPETRMRLEEEEAQLASEQAYLVELKTKCEKKGLNYEEELKKHNEELAAQKEKAQQKEAAIKEAKEKKEAEANAKAEAKYNSLSQEKKDKLKAKEEKVIAQYNLEKAKAEAFLKTL